MIRAVPWLLRGALRYLRLVTQLVALNGRIPNPIYVCISIDFDLRYKIDPLKGYEIIESLLARFGLTGKATYLINPYYWLGDDSAVYRELHESGVEIGLHTHAERMVRDEDPELGALVREQKERLERCFRRFDPQFSVRSFRSGSRVFSAGLFRVLEELDIGVDSTMGHFDRGRRVFDFVMDDAGTPDRVYHLDPAQFRRESAVPTRIVEIPVTSHLPDLKRLARALRRGEPLVISLFVHPFNFHRSGRPHWPFILFYAFILFCLRRIRHARFTHLSAAGAAWSSWFRSRAAAGTT